MLGKKIFAILIVSGVAFLTVPRLFLGYGVIGDTVRSVVSAERLLQTGVYIPSRLPGNPLFEYLLVLFVKWGNHIVTNSVILISYFLSILAFYKLSKDRLSAKILVVIFSFTPVLLVNAATTIDYIPGLTAMLWSYFYLRQEKYFTAGILLAISTGFRLSNCLFFLPALVFIFLRTRKMAHFLRFGIISVIGSVLLYFPIFLKAGFKTFEIPKDIYSGYLYILLTGHNAIQLFGLLGTIVFIIIVIINRERLGRSIADAINSRSASYAVEILTIVLYSILIAIHPEEITLIPAVPFIYLYVSRWAPITHLRFLLIAVVLYGFFQINMKGGISGERHFIFKPSYGVIVKDVISRNTINYIRKNISSLIPDNKAVVITAMGPILTHNNQNLIKSESIPAGMKKSGIDEANNIYKIVGCDVYFVYGLDRKNVEILIRNKWNIYCFWFPARSFLMHKYKYRPEDLGIKKIDMPEF
jgi:hypothetical protein